MRRLKRPSGSTASRGRTTVETRTPEERAERLAKNAQRQADLGRRKEEQQREDEAKAQRVARKVEVLHERGVEFADAPHAMDYFATRGLTPHPRLLKGLRYDSAVDYYEEGSGNGAQAPVLLATTPAIIADIHDVSGKIIGQHLTHLDPHKPEKWKPIGNPSNSARKIQGHVKGGMIRLGRPNVTMAIGEGIESVLSWHQLGHGPEDVALAAAVSLGNLKTVGLPKGVDAVIILADNNSDPVTLLRECRAAIEWFVQCGIVLANISIHWPPPGCDWNDVLLHEARGEPLREDVKGTEETRKLRHPGGIETGEEFLKRTEPPEPSPEPAPPPGDEPLPKLVPLRLVKGEVLPPREWIVHDGWIPARKTTLIQGDGGDGKTSLAQQLQSSCAVGLPWLGLRVNECVSVGFYTEDEAYDMKERQAAIDAAYGCDCVGTGNMHLFPRAEEDENELVVFDRTRRPILTKFFRQFREAALDFRARLAVLDVAVDLFGGNEIARQEVRAFFRPLNSVAREIDGGVVVTSHVSQAGIRSDGGHSASTDWSNACRSRLYLNRPKAENGDAADANGRLLTRKKANLARIGDTIKLHWENGLIVPDRVDTRRSFPRSADDVFLALVDAVTEEGQRASPKPRAGNYAPALFMKRRPQERDDYQRVDLERAMQRLLQCRKVSIIPYGPPSSGTQMIVRSHPAMQVEF